MDKVKKKRKKTSIHYIYDQSFRPPLRYVRVLHLNILLKIDLVWMNNTISNTVNALSYPKVYYVYTNSDAIMKLFSPSISALKLHRSVRDFDILSSFLTLLPCWINSTILPLSEPHTQLLILHYLRLNYHHLLCNSPRSSTNMSESSRTVSFISYFFDPMTT